MSHITNIKQTCVFTNIKALIAAIKEHVPDVEIVEGSHYRTWKDEHGRFVGDWPLPEGMTTEQVGDNAKWVIRPTDKWLKDHGLPRTGHNAPYEIGLVPVKVTRDPKTGKTLDVKYDPEGKEFVPMTDFYGQGNGLLNIPNIGRYEGSVPDPETGEKQEKAYGDLFMYYRMAEAKQAAVKKGHQLKFERLADGTWKATANTQAHVRIA